jgi:NAD(P)-dependent dehydrogenase (short-subunit alcohol dehydrogenase family)
MNGKVAVITGGAQGIGKATALRFLAKGTNVVLADEDEEAGREAVSEMSPAKSVLYLKTDVSDEDQVRRLTAHTVEHFGGVDVLVNNAAVSRGGKLTELTLADWNRVLAVNLTGPFLCAKHMTPHLRQRKGAIVNITSTRAFMSEPDTEAYAASKGGLVALTHALAASLAPDIRVNCISPGWIDTLPWKKKAARKVSEWSEADHKQHFAGRVGRPDDVAALVEFLTSEESDFITGSNFMVDGGMTRKMIYV